MSEWTTGLKIGAATYDERLHAFWLVLDDFSGGIGYRRLDIREALGTVWDNDDGADLRRAGHVTLPPLQATAALTAPGAADYTARQPSMPITGSSIGGTLANYGGFGGNVYQSTTGGASWTSKKVIANAVMISRILEFCPDPHDHPAGENALYVFCEGTSGTARYQRTTDGASYSDGGSGTQKVIEDAIVWNEMLIGTRPTPAGEIIFSKDGQAWNIDDASDGEPLYRAGYGRVQFVGVYTAPWGQSAVHFLARDDAGLNALFILDADCRQGLPIPVHNKRHLHDGVVWNGMLFVTDAYNVWAWDGVTIRNIAWPRKGGGIPPTLQGSVIVKLIGGTEYLYAILYRGDGKTQIIAYNGAGWSPLGPAVASFNSVVGGIVSKWVVATVATERRIVLMGGSAWNSAANPQFMTLRLPNTGEVPVVGTDRFNDGTCAFRTGWINGGFQELSGALYKLYCDGYNIDASETVHIGYRLDNDETAEFTSLGTFTAPGTNLTFPGSGAGLEFRTVQFEITLNRDSAVNTRSPELLALVLLYDKRPNFRSAWTFRIDVNQMIAEGIQVGGSDATFKNVWEKLIAIWNTKTLVVLNVPNIDTSVYVKIADMPATIDDTRDAVGGRGYLDVTLVEPV